MPVTYNTKKARQRVVNDGGKENKQQTSISNQTKVVPVQKTQQREQIKQENKSKKKNRESNKQEQQDGISFEHWKAQQLAYFNSVDDFKLASEIVVQEKEKEKEMAGQGSRFLNELAQAFQKPKQAHSPATFSTTPSSIVVSSVPPVSKMRIEETHQKFDHLLSELQSELIYIENQPKSPSTSPAIIISPSVSPIQSSMDDNQEDEEDEHPLNFSYTAITPQPHLERPALQGSPLLILPPVDESDQEKIQPRKWKAFQDLPSATGKRSRPQSQGTRSSSRLKPRDVNQPEYVSIQAEYERYKQALPGCLSPMPIHEFAKMSIESVLDT